MRTRIQRSMLFVICVTLVSTFTILITLFYFNSLNDMKEEVRQEISYIQTAVNISGDIYLKEMDEVSVSTRVTLIDKMGEHTLPARYFGVINETGGTAPSQNTSIRSMIETDYAVASQSDDARAKHINNQWVVHVFPGDLLPNGSTYLAKETYTQDPTILFKLYHKDSVPYMSAFEVGTSFFNPKSLTENRYLTFGHNTLEYLKNYPFITVRGE